METHSKNTGFGGLSRRRCLAIWNSAAWRASKGGKSENSIAWEAVTAGKSENSLAWEAPTGGKSENSLAWEAPTGGKSENSLAWGAPTGGKSENSLAWGAPTGGKSENSLAWGAPMGGEVKILSLGSPHGGKPPLAPLTDRNKPAVWAATPREAGWIWFNHKSNLVLSVPFSSWGYENWAHRAHQGAQQASSRTEVGCIVQGRNLKDGFDVWSEVLQWFPIT